MIKSKKYSSFVKTIAATLVTILYSLISLGLYYFTEWLGYTGWVTVFVFLMYNTFKAILELILAVEDLQERSGVQDDY